MSGYFITFEGGEGSGKSTQIQLLVDHISNFDPRIEPVVTREPGGTDSAESIRKLLVTGTAERWRAATEAMLMSASRHEHVVHVLRPALTAGKLVICDRYNDLTRVYQGVVGGVPRADIEALNNLACGDLVPDLTICWIWMSRKVCAVHQTAQGMNRALKARASNSINRSALPFSIWQADIMTGLS